MLSYIVGLYLLFNMSFQSCNDPQFPYDWSMQMEVRKKNSFYLSLEKERLMDREYTNYEVWLTQRWKYLELNGKTLRLDGRDITTYQIDIRGLYKNWSAGIGEYWYNGNPETRFFFGKQLDFDIKFFLIPLEVSFKSDISTKDFVVYNHEEHLWITFDFISFLDLYVKADVFDYGYLRWRTRLGVKINI